MPIKPKNIIKSGVKVMSLHNLITNNILLIIATLYHISILLSNQYSIEYLDEVILDFPETYKICEAMQFNLEICQAITLFTLFALYLAPEFIYIIKNVIRVTLEELRLNIMSVSFIIKSIYSLYDLYDNYDNEFKYTNYSEKRVFLFLIMLSYMASIIIFVSIFMFILLISCLDIMSIFAKKYKITYIERASVEEKKNI